MILDSNLKPYKEIKDTKTGNFRGKNKANVIVCLECNSPSFPIWFKDEYIKQL